MYPSSLFPASPLFCCHSCCPCCRGLVVMRASIQRATALFSVWLLLPSFVLSQCAETQQNPYCDPSFVNLICCPAPSVCYWIDRQGNPGCCAPGQVCGVGGGGAITVQPTTYVATQGTQPTATTTLVGGVVGTVTSGVVGVFSTVVRLYRLSCILIYANCKQ